MTKQCVLLVSLLLISLPLQASEKSRYFLVSAAVHPDIEPFKAIIRDSYAELGIEVVYMDMPVTRRFLELSQGNTDADLLARGDIDSLYPNVRKVQVPLTKANVFLVCAAHIPCDHSLLSDARQEVYTTQGNFAVTQKVIGKPILATIRAIDNNEVIYELFNSNKVDIILAAAIGDSLTALLRVEANYLEVSAEHLYHYVNAKHSVLLPELTKAIASRLPVEPAR